MENKVEMVPAPWELYGKGYILLYRFDSEFVNTQGNVPWFLRGSFARGIGSVMLVDYEISNVGPYSELLFIPGKFRHIDKQEKKRRVDTITKIYVSTEASVVNGIKNWAIPKEQAEFAFSRSENGVESAVIKQKDESIAEFEFKTTGPSFPVNTKWFPFPLVQHRDHHFFYTRFIGGGKGTFCKLTDVKINGALFPDISHIKPLAVIRVEPFHITFPLAKVQ